MSCPKHVEFYSKIKFKKLVHLIGFIIRLFHDARSPERQILLFRLTNTKISKGTSHRWLKVIRIDDKLKLSCPLNKQNLEC